LNLAVKKQSNRKPGDLNKIKSNQLPVVIYGAGRYAQDVNKFLARHSITTAAFAVDRTYIKEVKNQVEVIALDDLTARFPKCNLVIGFADYTKAKQSLKAHNLSQEAYFFDAPNELKLFDYKYFKLHQVEFERTYKSLEDEQSREVFTAFINAKISGDPSGLYDLAQFNQYFNDLIQLAPNEIFVDCGAYDGDSILEFSRQTKSKYQKIYAFEPEKKNIKKLQRNLKKYKVERVQVIKKGCWSKAAILHFQANDNMSAVSPKGSISVPVDTVDNVVGDEQVTYIKMDIEGAELQALRGAARTIRLNQPKLAICVYHKPDDLIKIPKLIKRLGPQYKLYLRQHQFISWETVLYAISAQEG
jgi:FkbM family methyltransferase